MSAPSFFAFPHLPDFFFFFTITISYHVIAPWQQLFITAHTEGEENNQERRVLDILILIVFIISEPDSFCSLSTGFTDECVSSLSLTACVCVCVGGSGGAAHSSQ